jgi:hypothetical protein
MTLDPDPRTRISAEIQLSKAVPLPGHPHSDPVHIDLTVHVPPFDPGDTADELTLTFSGERAVTLGRMLASAGRAARGDRP